MIDYNRNDGHAEDDGENAGGSGGASNHDSRRSDEGRSVIQDQRLIGRAIRNGWLKRWDTDSTRRALEEASDDRELTAKEKAMLAVHKALDSDDHRPAQIAVRNLLSMEEQNRQDEATDLGGVAFVMAHVSQLADQMFAGDPAKAAEFKRLALAGGGGTAGTVLAPGDDVIEMDQSVPAS